jgi:acetylornithine deacetylase/succinyl-diaminopimelate desuccinylase-like protein
MGARWLVETHFADLDPAFMLDEGGLGRRGFYSAGDTFEIVVDEKRLLRLRLVARAEPGHASMPWKDAATHRLVRAAHTLLEQAAEDRDTPTVAEMIKRLGGEVARREIASQRASMPLLHDTLSLTMLSGGYKINIIPERAEMSFDCRLLPDTDERAFVSNVEQLINDPGVSVEVVDWPDAASVTAPWDAGLFEALEQACRTHVPHAVVTPAICVGGTDARHFRQRGVHAYGLVPGLFTAEDLKGFHGVDERMSVDNLRLGTQIIHDATLRVASSPRT